MKTNNTMKNFANRIDKAIPDATPEYVVSKCKDIGTDVKATAMAVCYSSLCATQTVLDTTELGLALGKTVVKTVGKTVIDCYNSAPTMVTVRR